MESARLKKWDVYSAICAYGEEHGSPPNENAADDIRRQEFIELFKQYLAPPARILAPGALAEAPLLAEAGYEIHALQLPGPNTAWLRARRDKLTQPERLIIREIDAHDLDYPPNFFDGYFSVQFNEHLLSWLIHIGEVRYCSRVGAIAFIDACGTTNPAMYTVRHTNLVNEKAVHDQWNFWGWKERWRGPLIGSQGETGGDNRPQFIFEMLPPDSLEFRHRECLNEIMRHRGELS